MIQLISSDFLPCALAKPHNDILQASCGVLSHFSLREPPSLKASKSSLWCWTTSPFQASLLSSETLWQTSYSTNPFGSHQTQFVQSLIFQHLPGRPASPPVLHPTNCPEMWELSVVVLPLFNQPPSFMSSTVYLFKRGLMNLMPLFLYPHCHHLIQATILYHTQYCCISSIVTLPPALPSLVHVAQSDCVTFLPCLKSM